MITSGCGSGISPAQRATLREQAADRARALTVKRETIAVEASDMSPHTSCQEWLKTSAAARDAYLLRKWPYLPAIEALRVVHDQDLSCQVAPPHEAGRHAPMESLQPAVDVVVWGLAVFYEETVAVGIRESVQEYLERVSGHPRHHPSTG